MGDGIISGIWSCPTSQFSYKLQQDFSMFCCIYLNFKSLQSQLHRSVPTAWCWNYWAACWVWCFPGNVLWLAYLKYSFSLLAKKSQFWYHQRAVQFHSYRTQSNWVSISIHKPSSSYKQNKKSVEWKWLFGTCFTDSWLQNVFLLMKEVRTGLQ